MLAETARVAGKSDVQKDALRKVIAADTGDLVSQVHYIDLLARAAQTVEERSAVYQKALQEASLDRQIRSEMALRLARLEEGRGDAAQARNYLGQAIQLNDVNVGALRDLVRLAAQDGSPTGAGTYLKTLVTLLAANPYQADAWLQLARLCEAAGVHDRAGDFLEAGGEQLAIDGMLITGDFRLELALEYGAAGKSAQAYRLAEALAELPDAPLAALLVAELLSQNLPVSATSAMPAAATTSQPATQPFQRTAEIRKRLSELAKETDNAAALADAAGAALTILPEPGPEAAMWVDTYAKLVAPDDATLARLRGWQLFREGKLDDARVVLEKVADTDPLARVGLARVLMAQGGSKIQSAGGLLQSLWANNPTGLLALQVVLAAQKAKIDLGDAPRARDVRSAVIKLTPALVGAYRQPLEMQLISAHFRKDAGAGTPTTATGEPVMLQLRLTNTSGRALPVGSDGVVKSVVGLAGTTRSVGGTDPAALGLFAIEDLQRVYRLEAQQIVEATLQADQGKLADIFQQHPENTFDVNVTVVTAPRVLGSQQYSLGVGGLIVFPGDFRRMSFPLTAPAEWERLTQEITTLNGDKQLIRIEVADAVLAGAAGADGAQKGKLAGALVSAAGNGDARVKATLLRGLPAGASPELERAVAGMANDADPLVRLAWAMRQGRMAMGGAEAATSALEKQAAAEQDEAIKSWLQAELDAIKAKK